MEGVVTIRLDDSKTILLIAAIAGVIAIGALSSGSSSYPGGGGGGGNYHQVEIRLVEPHKSGRTTMTDANKPGVIR